MLALLDKRPLLGPQFLCLFLDGEGQSHADIGAGCISIFLLLRSGSDSQCFDYSLMHSTSFSHFLIFFVRGQVPRLPRSTTRISSSQHSFPRMPLPNSTSDSARSAPFSLLLIDSYLSHPDPGSWTNILRIYQPTQGEGQT